MDADGYGTPNEGDQRRNTCLTLTWMGGFIVSPCFLGGVGRCSPRHELTFMTGRSVCMHGMGWDVCTSNGRTSGFAAKPARAQPEPANSPTRHPLPILFYSTPEYIHTSGTEYIFCHGSMMAWSFHRAAYHVSRAWFFFSSWADRQDVCMGYTWLGCMQYRGHVGNGSA